MSARGFGSSAFGVTGNDPYLSRLTVGAGYLKYRAALAARALGTRNAKILCVGMSTTRGVGATDILSSWPRRLADLMTASGTPAGYQSWLGAGNVAFTFDPRVTQTAMSTIGPNGLGGASITGNDVLDAYAYHPTVQCDTFELHWLRLPSGGTINAAFNAAPPTAINTAGTAVGTGLQTTVISGAIGDNTLNLTFPAGQSYFRGIYAYNSTAKIVDVINAGWSAMTSIDLAATGNAQNGIFAIAYYAPDLTIVSCDINDWTNSSGISVATYRANMLAFLTAAKAAGDVLVISSRPSDTGSATTARQESYLAVEKEVAIQLGLGFYDQWTRGVSWTAANAVGMMTDNLHDSPLGYVDAAHGVFSALEAIAA